MEANLLLLLVFQLVSGFDAPSFVQKSSSHVDFTHEPHVVTDKVDREIENQIGDDLLDEAASALDFLREEETCVLHVQWIAIVGKLGKYDMLSTVNHLAKFEMPLLMQNRLGDGWVTTKAGFQGNLSSPLSSFSVPFINVGAKFAKFRCLLVFRLGLKTKFANESETSELPSPTDSWYCLVPWHDITYIDDFDGNVENDADETADQANAQGHVLASNGQEEIGDHQIV